MNRPVSSVRQRPLPGPDVAREWLGSMLLVRRFDERASELRASGQIGGHLQLATGEEALAVGATRALEPRDWLLSTWRPHALAVARGTPAAAVMAELLGRVTGTNGGYAGPSLLSDPEHRMLGGWGIVGAHLPVAAGVATAATQRGRAEVVMAVMGDGAQANGLLAETLDLGALWSLPVVIVVARELTASPDARAADAAQATLARKAEGFGVKTLDCDGMDVVAAQETCAEAVRIARSERRPVLVQATLHRAPTASLASAQAEGDDHAIAAWKQRDPVTAFGDRIVEVGLLEHSERARLQMQAGALVEQAVTRAARGAAADPAALTRLAETGRPDDAADADWVAVDVVSSDAAGRPDAARPGTRRLR